MNEIEIFTTKKPTTLELARECDVLYRRIRNLGQTKIGPEYHEPELEALWRFLGDIIAVLRTCFPEKAPIQRLLDKYSEYFDTGDELIEQEYQAIFAEKIEDPSERETRLGGINLDISRLKKQQNRILYDYPHVRYLENSVELDDEDKTPSDSSDKNSTERDDV